MDECCCLFEGEGKGGGGLGAVVWRRLEWESASFPVCISLWFYFLGRREGARGLDMGSLASKAAKLFERTAKNPTVESKAKKILWTKEDHSRNELMGTAMGVVGPTTEK